MISLLSVCSEDGHCYMNLSCTAIVSFILCDSRISGLFIVCAERADDSVDFAVVLAPVELPENDFAESGQESLGRGGV